MDISIDIKNSEKITNLSTVFEHNDARYEWLSPDLEFLCGGKGCDYIREELIIWIIRYANNSIV